MSSKRKIPRRDQCHAAATRAMKLLAHERERAWRHLALELEVLSERDMPKYADLFRAIRQATIKGRDSTYAP